MDRQTAADLLDNLLGVVDDNQGNDYDTALRMGIKALKADVPQVRCKDCKHWIPYDWMFSEVWKSQNIDDYAESEIGCTYCDMSMCAMDYCSRWERKNGGL